METTTVRFARLPLLVLPVALVLGACGGKLPPDGVVARSAFGETTYGDLEDYILSLPDARRQPAEGQDLEDWRRKILEDMLVTRRLTEEADEKDLLASAEGRSYLESLWLPILTRAVRDRRIASTVQISEKSSPE